MFKSLGDKIATLRKDIGMTQQQMAEKIGISRPSIVKIENSQRAISLDPTFGNMSKKNTKITSFLPANAVKSRSKYKKV